jgi:uncharacterized protein (TIGR02001 family)
MKKLVLVSAVAAALAMPVAQAAEQSAHTVTGNVGLFSNYIFRGVTQTSEELALQGGFDYSHASGLYAGTWGSNISWLADSEAAVASTNGYTGSSLELDLYGGYKGTFASDFGYDVGAIYYYYPGEQARGFVSPNTTEVYAGLSWKWLSAKVSYAVSEYFGFLDSEGTYYVDLSANVPIGKTGLTVMAHAGYLMVEGDTAGACTVTLGTTPTCSNNDAYGYTDWKLGVSYALPQNFTVAAVFTDTNGEDVAYTVAGRNWADKQAAVYVQKTF